MPNYEKMYYHLFNAVSTAIEEMERCNYGAAAERLVHAQLVCEEIFLQDAEGRGVQQEALPERKNGVGIVLL